MRRAARLGVGLLVASALARESSVAATGEHGAALVRLLGPHASEVLAPVTGQIGALVAIPQGSTAQSLGLDAVAPGIGRLRAPAGVVMAFADAHPDLHVELTPPARLMLTSATASAQLAQAQARSGFRGKGVAVGVADTGLDVSLPDFRDPLSNKTRVAWYLDLSRPPLGAHPELEARFGLKDGNGKVIAGAVLSADDIDALQLRGDPLPVDEVGHGTHVTSIAAGNGGGTPYAGFAPEATLIIARVTRSASTSIENDDILRGAEFIFDRGDALGVPVVANFSLGSDFGPHDGTTLWEKTLASHVGASKPGHALIVAAGNSGSVVETPVHQSVHVTRGPTVRVPIVTSGAKSGTVEVWVTERSGASLSIGLDGPDGEWIAPVADGDQVGKNTHDYNAGVVHGASASGSVVPRESRGATVVWSGKWSAGTYYVTLSGEGTAELYLQGIGDADLYGPTPARFAVGVREGTVDLPGTHPDLIAVGATVNRADWRSIGGQRVGVGVPVLDGSGRLMDASQPLGAAPAVGDVAWFSGAGPTASGVSKPDILAPGGIVIAALSQQALPGVATSIFTTPTCPGGDKRCLQIAPRLGVSLGTSMAAPMAAGVAALLFERDRTLSQDLVRALLQAGAHRVRGAAPFYDQSGPGELDAAGALAALEELEHPVVALPDPASSWMTLSAGFAAADASAPLRVVLELRAADGHRANLFELSRLTPVALVGGRAAGSAPVMMRAAAPGLFYFDVALPAGLGGESLTVGARFDGADLVAPVTVPISNDPWSSSFSARAKGACSVSAPGLPGSGAAWALAMVAGAFAIRRRRR